MKSTDTLHNDAKYGMLHANIVMRIDKDATKKLFRELCSDNYFTDSNELINLASQLDCPDIILGTIHSLREAWQSNTWNLYFFEVLPSLPTVDDLVNGRQQETGNSPLHFAAMWNSTQAIQVLVHHNADLAHRNKDGKSAADLAFKHSSMDAFIMLTCMEISQINNSIALTRLKAANYSLSSLKTEDVRTIHTLLKNALTSPTDQAKLTGYINDILESKSADQIMEQVSILSPQPRPPVPSSAFEDRFFDDTGLDVIPFTQIEAERRAKRDKESCFGCLSWFR